MKLTDEELTKMLTVMNDIVNGDGTNSDMSANEAADFRFFVQKLRDTGFF